MTFQSTVLVQSEAKENRGNVLLSLGFDLGSNVNFRRIRKIAKRHYQLRHVRLSVCLSRCLSVRIEQLDFHRTEFHDILTFEIFSKNLSRKVKFHYNLTRIMDTLHEDLCTFLAGFFLECEIFQTFVENIKTHILRSINFFPKIVPFFR